MRVQSEHTQKFINLLGAELEKEFDIQVMHSSGDADFKIMKLDFNIVTWKPVGVVGDDTYLPVLLLHHYSQDEHKYVYMQLTTKLINTPVLQKGQLEHNMAHYLLFIDV